MKKTIRILLTDSQRKLIMKYEPFFADEGLYRLIAVALKQGDGYEIVLDEDQFEDLLDQVCELSNQETSARKQKPLDDLCDMLEAIYEGETGGLDEGGGDFSGCSSNSGAVCMLKVMLMDDSTIWRKIAIREGQTLDDLHEMIFDAFDRYDEHLYSFFFPQQTIKRKDMRNIYEISDEYTHPSAYADSGPFGGDGQDASAATIAELDLAEGQEFYYLFDFGDEWWHEIRVEQCGQMADEGEYPRIVERKGKSPEQYSQSGDEIEEEDE